MKQIPNIVPQTEATLPPVTPTIVQIKLKSSVATAYRVDFNPKLLTWMDFYATTNKLTSEQLNNSLMYSMFEFRTKP